MKGKRVQKTSAKEHLEQQQYGQNKPAGDFRNVFSKGGHK